MTTAIRLPAIWWSGLPTAASDSWTTLTSPSATDTSYDDSGLSPGTERHYRIRAVNGTGNGAWSATRSATTPPDVPGVPTLSANANGENAIDLAWEPPSYDGGAAVSGYEIHVSTDGTENSYSEADQPVGFCPLVHPQRTAARRRDGTTSSARATARDGATSHSPSTARR